MKLNINKRRKDWGLIIFILPLGVVMMMCVGQLAIRMSPSWSVSGDMQSSIDPAAAPKENALIIPPISIDILTPESWWDTFLTPVGDSNSDVVYPPFVIFVSTETPTAWPTATPSDTPTATATVTSTVTATGTAVTPTPTKKPKVDPTIALCTDANATNNGGPAPCTYPTPSPTALVGTPDGGTPPPGYNNGSPDNSVAGITDGHYVIVNLSATPIVVTGISDTNYDLVYYERATGGGVDMDRVILSISMDNVTYYVVFNWGDGLADNNTNVGDVTTNTGTENDNQHIDAAELYDPDGGGPAPDTGIQIDVDNAPSHPPPGSYQYLAIQAPTPTTGNDGADVDSVEVLP